MFWRRRKLPEDDQPLVPHGLVSQALEEQASAELPPDMWDNSPKDVARAPAEPTTVPVPAAVPPSAHAQPAGTSAEQGKISPPMRWPRVDEAEVARRAQLIDAAVSFPYRKPLVGALVPKTVEPAPEPELLEPAKLGLVPDSPSIQAPAAQQKTSNKLIARLRSVRLRSFSERWRIVRKAKILAQLKTAAGSHWQATAQKLHQLRQTPIPSLETAKPKGVDDSRAAISQSQPHIQSIREKIRALDTSGVTRAWKRARSLQVTVRIPHSNFKVLGSLAARANISRNRVQRALQHDSRLWTSMAMAALSAVLALWVVSSLRHYGPARLEAQPVGPGTVHAFTSRTEAAGSNVALKPAPPTGERKPSPIASTAENGHAAERHATVQVSKKDPLSPVVKKPRVRRSRVEDDYVAKDTYVYYGSSGKRSR